jgi:hypothetical protein
MSDEERTTTDPDGKRIGELLVEAGDLGARRSPGRSSAPRRKRGPLGEILIEQ